MGFCISLTNEDSIGLDGEFNEQLYSIGLQSEWYDYKECQLMPGKLYDEVTLNAHGRRFCHLRGIAVLIGSTILMSRVPKRSGHVARYPVLVSVLRQHGLKEDWDDYFIGSAFGLLDNDGVRESSNWGIFWQDVDRFFTIHDYQLEPLIKSSLPHDTVMNLVKGNLKLSNFNLSDEQMDVVSLVANGIISDQEALKRFSSGSICMNSTQVNE